MFAPDGARCFSAATVAAAVLFVSILAVVEAVAFASACLDVGGSLPGLLMVLADDSLFAFRLVCLQDLFCPSSLPCL